MSRRRRWVREGYFGTAAPEPLVGIFIAPDGNDTTGDGTEGNPYASLLHVHDNVLADNTGAQVYMRGGTYDIATEFGLRWTKSGAGDLDRIKVFAYPGETPVMDYTNLTAASDSYPGVGNAGGDGVFIDGASFTHWKGITFKKAHLVGFEIYGLSGPATHHKLEQCVFTENGIDGSVGYGFATYSDADHIELINCDASKNYNSIGAGTNADGFQCSNTGAGGGNVMTGCRAWLNGDDGFDFFALFDNETNGDWEVSNCWAWKNGYQADGVTPSTGDGNGFKMGGSAVTRNNGAHTYTNCLAFENRVDGFDENEADVVQTVYNCSAWSNGAKNWDFPGTNAAHVLRNNISYNYAVADTIAAAIDDRYNNWDLGLNCTSGDFVSVSSTGVDGPRGADGSLPVLDLMKLSSTSKLVDAGVDVGLSYNSTAPDLGAYESAFARAAEPTFVRTMYVNEQTSAYEFTTSNSAWQYVSGVSFQPDASTDYYIIWSAEVAAPAVTTSDVQYRLFDGTNALASGNIEPKDTVPEEWFSIGGVNRFQAGSTPPYQSLTLQIKSEGVATNVRMRNAKMTVIKGIASDEYVSTAAGQAGIGTSETTVQTLTWTPTGTKDYIIIGSAGMGPVVAAPGETQLRLKFGGNERARNYALYNDAGSVHSQMVVHYTAGASGLTTFTLDAIHSHATNTATVKDRNILALDVTGMAVYQNSTLPADGGTSNTQSYVDSYTNSQSYAATKKHLVLVSSGVRGASATISAYNNLTVAGVQIAEQVREPISTTQNTGFSVAAPVDITAGSRAVAQQVKNESGTGAVQIFQAKQVTWQIEA